MEVAVGVGAFALVELRSVGFETTEARERVRERERSLGTPVALLWHFRGTPVALHG